MNVYVITRDGRRLLAARDFERTDLAETYAATIAQAIARERRAARLEGRHDPHSAIRAVEVDEGGSIYSISRLAFGLPKPRVRARGRKRRQPRDH